MMNQKRDLLWMWFHTNFIISCMYIVTLHCVAFLSDQHNNYCSMLMRWFCISRYHFLKFTVFTQFHQVTHSCMYFVFFHFCAFAAEALLYIHALYKFYASHSQHLCKLVMHHQSPVLASSSYSRTSQHCIMGTLGVGTCPYDFSLNTPHHNTLLCSCTFHAPRLSLSYIYSYSEVHSSKLELVRFIQARQA